MEVFGLILAIPAVLVANLCYVLLARFGLVRFERLRPWLLWPSYFVMIVAVVEVLLVLTQGAVQTRALAGSVFWVLHTLVFLFGAPALANVLLLTRPGVWFRRWYAAVVLCGMVGVFLVFFQVGVAEALDRADGVGDFSE